MTQQPTWRYVTNLGDVNPIEHGGAFVFVDTTAVYPPEMEILEPPCDDIDIDDDDARWAVSRIVLDPCMWDGKQLSDNPFHP